MNEQREFILEKVRTHIGATRRQPVELAEDARLIDLGLDSMGVITTLLMLEREVGLDFDRMISSTPPRTLGDLVDMAASGLAPEGARTSA